MENVHFQRKTSHVHRKAQIWPIQGVKKDFSKNDFTIEIPSLLNKLVQSVILSNSGEIVHQRLTYWKFRGCEEISTESKIIEFKEMHQVVSETVTSRAKTVSYLHNRF